MWFYFECSYEVSGMPLFPDARGGFIEREERIQTLDPALIKTLGKNFKCPKF